MKSSVIYNIIFTILLIVIGILLVKHIEKHIDNEIRLYKFLIDNSCKICDINNMVDIDIRDMDVRDLEIKYTFPNIKIVEQ